MSDSCKYLLSENYFWYLSKFHIKYFKSSCTPKRGSVNLQMFYWSKSSTFNSTPLQVKVFIKHIYKQNMLTKLLHFNILIKKYKTICNKVNAKWKVTSVTDYIYSINVFRDNFEELSLSINIFCSFILPLQCSSKANTVVLFHYIYSITFKKQNIRSNKRSTHNVHVNIGIS